jgi:hypothetical protein
MKKTWGLFKRNEIYWIDIRIRTERIRKSTKETDVAKAISFRDKFVAEHSNGVELNAKKAAGIHLLDVIESIDPEWHAKFSEMKSSGFIKQKYSGLKQSAKKRGIGFHLTEQDHSDLILESQGRCSLTNIPLVIDKSRHPFKMSVDRIDASGPYEKWNCRVVSFCVNAAIAEFGEDTLAMMSLGYVSVTLARNLGMKLSQQKAKP